MIRKSTENVLSQRRDNINDPYEVHFATNETSIDQTTQEMNNILRTETSEIDYPVDERESECQIEMEYDEDIAMEDDTIKESNSSTDIIGYSTPFSLFHLQIKKGTVYIPRYVTGKYNGFYRPIHIESKEYDLPGEVVKSWDVVRDGSNGFYMKLDRVGGFNTEVRYDAKNIYFGHDEIKYIYLEEFMSNYKRMTNIPHLSYSINIETINIGCQKGIYIRSLLELYKRMRELNA